MKKAQFYTLFVCLALSVVAFKRADTTSGYFFSWGLENQKSDGNRWAITQPFYVKCNKNSTYLKTDIAAAFSKFYTKHYKTGYSYLSSPPVEGPFKTEEEAQDARTKKIKEWGKEHPLLYIDNFRYSCEN